MRHAVVLLAFALLLACAGDTTLDQAPPPVQDTSLAGVVTGVDGIPIAGAVVTLGDRTALTEADGAFTFGALEPGADLLVAARADGFSSVTQPVRLGAQTTSLLQLRLAEARTLLLPDAALGGRLVGPDGVAVEIPAGSLRHADGSLAGGSVHVTYTLLNTPHSVLAAPGGMLAAEAPGAPAFPLESFGMVELTLSQQGEPLTFEGRSRLEIPLSATSEHTDGDTIPMWAFDEQAGVWLEEGEAVVQGDRAIAEVSHYTYWNCDMPMETSGIKGQLVDRDGAPLRGISVVSEGIDYMGSSGVSTSDAGYFCVPVRKGGKARLTTFHGPEAAWEWALDVETPHDVGGCGDPDGIGVIDIGQQVAVLVQDGDIDGDGWTTSAGDCDDEDPGRHPGVTDLCNGTDDDCDGQVDEVSTDADGDGYSDCVDCDDSDPTVHPFAADICGDVIDRDCDGEIGTWNVDADGDGLTPCDGDCDDGDATVTDACAFEALEAGGFFTCGLQADGLVRCWGWEEGLVWTPPPLQFTAVRAGHFMGCGVTIDQSVQCWTDEGLLSTSPVDGAFSDISVGEDHGCGVRADGALQCWGTDDAGETSPPDGTFTQVASGRDFSCAVEQGSAPTCWGNDEYDLTAPRLIEATAVTAGAFHACALRTDGRAECWGRDVHGEATAPPLTFTQLDAGWEHTCGLVEGGGIRCWGSDSYGESQTPAGTFEHVTAGRNHTCGIRAGGQVECWGLDAQGQANDPFGG